MLVSEQAVQAAARKDAEMSGRTFDALSSSEKKRYLLRSQEQLTAALPFLQGVKVEPMETAPNGKGAQDPSVIEVHEGAWAVVKGTNGKDAGWVDTHDLFAHQLYRHHTLSAIEFDPTSRAQALEEGDLLKRATLIIEGRSTAVNSEFIESLSNRKAWEVAEIIADNDIKLGAEIRALSSQPVADGWLPIETAPKDTVVLMTWNYQGKWEYEAGIYGSTRGGWLHGQATHWRPLPASPELAE